MNTGNCRGAATGRNIHQKDTESAVKMTAACHAMAKRGISGEALEIFQSWIGKVGNGCYSSRYNKSRDATFGLLQ